jgi:hypothetical protein
MLASCSKAYIADITEAKSPSPLTKTTVSRIITPGDSPSIPVRGFFMGLLPTPVEGETFSSVYRKASAFTDFVPVWGQPTPFYNLASVLSGDWGKMFVEEYIRGNGMFPLIHMSFIGPDMTLITPAGIPEAALENLAWRQSYKQVALNVVRSARPLYISLGNEVNRWYEKYDIKEDDPNGFQNYVSLYNEIYDEVKQISPQTKIFCTFAREIVSENREADLDVLSLFDSNRMDILVFTSYPYAVQGIRRPQDIPDDYYTRALSYMPGKAFGLSEFGWPALEAFGGEQAQADFIIQVAGRLTDEQGIKLHFLCWPWLSALDENDSVAFVKSDGSERQAFTVWKKLFSVK